MKKLNKVSAVVVLGLPKMVLVLFLLLILWATPAFAHRNPLTCSGSGLGINLYTDNPQVHIGDVVSYDAEVFNGQGSGPIVCDATDITASIVTPDGVNHSISLIRTSLSNGQFDSYPAVVTYTVRAIDVTSDNTLVATASDVGTIHQNDTNSLGGGNQGLNTTVVFPATLHIVKTVVNDNDGVATASLFSLHVKLSGTDVSGSPAAGVGLPGTSYLLDPDTYTVSEDINTSYTQSFTGDCDSSGIIVLASGDDKTCTITNDDIASVVVPPRSGGSYHPPKPSVVPPSIPLVIATPSPIAEIVDTPSFPKTGFFSDKESVIWNIALFVGNITIFIVALFVILKKRTN